MTGADVVRLAQELVRMPSTPESGGQAAIAHLLADRLVRHGFTVDLDDYAEGHTNVVARWGDPDRPAVCLTGHLDTVSVVESAWGVDPWGAELRDGRLWGRGSADMKGGVAALVLAAEEYVASPPDDAAPVALVLTAQEEVGSLGAAAVAAAGAVPASRVLVVAEPTSNRPAVGHRGVVWLDVVARGRAAHASTPHLGENAIEKLMDALQRLRAWSAADTLHDDVLGPRTLNIGRCEGGLLRNIVPDVARAELDIRTPRRGDATELADALQRLVGELASVDVALNLPPVLTDPDDEWVRLARRLTTAPADVTGPPVVARFFTDASVFTPALGEVPTVICGPGSPDQAHVVDEFCAIDDIVAAQDIYAGLLRAAGSPVQR
jgi:succinyl-diaminopimelate desuccinylase